MQKRSKKSWSKLAARITLGLLVAGSTLGWAQGASAEGETKFKITGWTDGKPVCDTSVSGFGQIKYEIKDNEPMLYGKMDWALSNPTDPIFEVYYESTGGDPLEYAFGKASLCGSYAKDAAFSANNSKVVVTAGKLASVTGGAMSGNGKAENNIVEISETAAIADSVSGAFSFGDANNNEVKINGAVLDINTINGAFLRGENTNGKGNSVLIDSESINAQTISGAKGHQASNINLTENTLTIKNANLGGYSNTEDIFIKIAGASTSGIRSDGSDSGSAERNTLELYNVTVGEGYILDAYGGFGNKNVEWNYVDIKNSTIKNPNSAITGGFAYGGNVKDNTVSIENSTIKGLVYAAMAGANGAKDVDATAVSNKIILKGTLDLKEARLYAVNEQKMAYGKRSNALILDGLTSTNNSTEIRSVNYFNYIDFGTVNLTSDNTSEHAYLKLSNDDKSNFLDEKTSLYGSISGTGYLMTGYFDGSKLDVSYLKNKFLGGSSVQDYLTGNGVKLTGYDVEVKTSGFDSNNYVKVVSDTDIIALAGIYTDVSGKVYVNGDVSGSSGATEGTLTLNSKIENSTIGKVCGSYNVATNEKSTATGGKLTINSTNGVGAVDIFGNYSLNGDAKSTSTAVNVTGGTLYNAMVFGNYTKEGTNVIGTQGTPVISLNNVAKVGNIYGGYFQQSGDKETEASYNEVLIKYDDSKSGQGEHIYGVYGGTTQKNNKVEIDGNFTTSGNVYGAYFGYIVQNNAVVLKNGAQVKNAYGADVSISGKDDDSIVISGNSVTINKAIVPDYVLGVNVYTLQEKYALAKENFVSITDGSIEGDNRKYILGAQAKHSEKNNVYIKDSIIFDEDASKYSTIAGGYYDYGFSDKSALYSKGNTVTIEGTSKVRAIIAGGYLKSVKYNDTYYGDISGTVENNTVTIGGTSIIEKVTGSNVGVIGGYIGGQGKASGDVKNNTVTIKDSAKVETAIYGGYTVKGEANYNKVVVSGGAYISNVWGGSASVAENNIVTIGTAGDTTTVVNGDIYGASGINVSKNEVNLLGGSINNIWGAIGTTVEENVVTISGGATRTEYSGGYIIGGEADSFSGDGNDLALNNIVNISSGDFKADVWGNLSSYGSAKGDGIRANVSISGGAINGNIYGGSGEIAEKNIVSISGGTINGRYDGVIGGWGTTVLDNEISITGGTINSKVTGGSGTTVSENKISISGGTINDKVTGGDGINGLRYTGSGFAANDSTVSGNIVEISGGTFGGEEKTDVYAGYSKTITDYGITSKGTIENNKIVITKGENLNVATSLVNANLYGSNLAASETSGNTLELKNANLNGLKVNTINNFNKIDFGDLIFANNTTLDKAFVTLSMSDASNLVGTVLYADSVNGSGILLTGKFSAKDVTLAGALEATGNKEIVAALDAGGVKVGISTGTKVRFGNDTSSEAIENNYIQLTAGSTTYDKMAGKYIDASGKESGSGTLTLSATPDAAIKNIAGVYSNDISKVATGGTLNLSGGTYAADVKVYGGYSDGGTVIGNHLNICGGTFNVTENSNGHIIGGSSIKGTAEGNIIDISGADTVIYKYIYGGHGKNANKNEVKISNGTLNGVVYGSRVNDGEATENSVQISGGTINSVVYGGYSLHIGDSSTSKANDNKVVISGGTINSYVVGGAGYEAKDNKIIIKQGIDKAASLVNARLEGNSKETMNATDNNSLIIENLGAGTIIGSVKNFNSISFGDVALGDISYLTINGGSLNGTVITAGKLTGEGDLISGVSTTGVNVEALKGEAGKDKITALTNGVQYAVGGGTEVTVNVTSIHVKANAPDTVKALTGVFYGDDGKAEKGITDGVLTLDGSVDPADDVIYAGAYAKKGKASGGTVKVTGDFEGTVYGGYSADGNGAENNTLEIDGSKSVTVNKIEAVDTINITGKVAKNGEKAVLNVTNKADFAKANV